jgi:hypothetical protein
MTVIKSLYDTEKPFLRNRIGRDCFVIDFYFLFISFTHDLRMLTLPFAVNIILGIIGNIFFKSSLIRSLEIVINIQSANSHKLRFHFISI